MDGWMDGWIDTIKVKYAINRTEFMKKLSEQAYNKKNLSFDELLTTNYFFLLFICTW